MARTISQLTAGTIIYVDETISGSTKHVPYFYLGLDESGNARLLRQKAVVQKRMHSSNAAGYDGCEADQWLENTVDGFLARFDSATMQALQNTAIKYVDYNQSGNGSGQILTIARRCFLLSYSEEGFGNDQAGSEGQSCLSALKTATGQTADNSARITSNEAGVAVHTWMRSANSTTDFRFVYNDGHASYVSATSGSRWLRPALSVVPTTPVSDDGVEAIFLLPEGRRTYWGIEAAISLGKTARRPKSCKLALPHDSFSVLNVQVCNNFSDASPSWLNCGDGQTADFGTSKMAQDWELGVKIHAEAPAANRTIGEPAMIVGFAL